MDPSLRPKRFPWGLLVYVYLSLIRDRKYWTHAGGIVSEHMLEFKRTNPIPLTISLPNLIEEKVESPNKAYYPCTIFMLSFCKGFQLGWSDPLYSQVIRLRISGGSVDGLGNNGYGPACLPSWLAIAVHPDLEIILWRTSPPSANANSRSVNTTSPLMLCLIPIFAIFSAVER